MSKFVSTIFCLSFLSCAPFHNITNVNINIARDLCSNNKGLDSIDVGSSYMTVYCKNEAMFNWEMK